MRIAADLVRIDLGQAEGLEMAFKNARGLDGLLVQWDFLFSILASQIAQRAAQERVPAIYENRAQVVAGGLMSYGSDVRELSGKELPMLTASSRVLARLIFPSFKRVDSNWLSTRGPLQHSGWLFPTLCSHALMRSSNDLHVRVWRTKRTSRAG